eukprot:TRINITY_DN8641_c0_g1_i4.p1 TRINITY_DN8641_c0_g1~~TRINITY_DN8641_c0_g1_i4.p1  ORF type:complete len:182 (+),score=14.11 TRINITY_DN8641_c0_g1_i4:196-741(+)
MNQFDRTICTLISFTGLTATTVLQLIRLYSPQWDQIYLDTFKGILRPHELDSLFPGASHFQFGCLLCVFFFDPEIVKLSIIILSFADPFASLTGIFFKKRFCNYYINSKKTWVGTFGGALAAAIAYFIIERNLQISGIIALTAVIAERIPTKREWGIDDNWTIPLGSSIMLIILLKGFQLK